MTKLTKIILAYLIAIPLEVFFYMLYANSIGLLVKDVFSLPQYILIVFSVIVILLAPFIILAIIGYRKKKIVLQGIAKGYIIWNYIAVIPAMLVYFLISSLENNSYFYLFGLIQILISSCIILYYKLPKGLILLALFIPGLSNLYFLIYGIVKRSKKEN